MDVSVVAAAPSAGDVPCLLMRRELAKHHRYPGPGLVPFALASRGRQANTLNVLRRTVEYIYI